eukprot:Em0006g848a
MPTAELASVIPWGLGHTLSLLVGSWSLFQTGLSMSILVEFVTDDMTLISITPGCSLSNSNVWECPNALRG